MSEQRAGMELLNESRARCVVLPDRLRRELERRASRAYPREACGLLLGKSEPQVTRVVEMRELRNATPARAHERYEFDPVEHMAVEREASELGFDVVGLWHSHPDRPAHASADDFAAAWAGWCYLILAVTDRGVVDTRCWQLVGNAFVAQAITC